MTVDRFEAFVLRFQDLVFATAVRLLGNETEAEDVAQTVFMKAFERAEAVVESPAAAGWLRTVTTNACLNHLSRYRSRWRLFSELQRSDAAGDAVPFDPPAADSASPAVDLETADREAVVERALRLLPAHQRVPLVLYHFESASYQEIADSLGTSLAKVKTDIHRGREALRRVLADHGPR